MLCPSHAHDDGIMRSSIGMLMSLAKAMLAIQWALKMVTAVKHNDERLTS